ncbi:MAG: tetratricopeptide repeat protein [Bacteroides sp.]|nr:tetratricopeptide repeat protein [Bacteroides sp.]
MEKNGGVYYIPGKVNGLPLKFIFDTGASKVYISLTEALFMLKNNYISEADLGGKSYAQVADGSIVENTEVILREIEVGGIKLHNIKAYVSNSLDAPLLFGQSAIQKLGPIQINGNELIISNGSNLPSNESALSLYQKAYQAAEAENYDDAIRLSEQAITLATDNKLRAMLYDNIAYSFYHSGRKEKAIEALNTALGEDMMCDQAGYNLGVYYYEMGLKEKALRALNLFIERHGNPQNQRGKDFLSGAYAYKGNCHSERGEIKDAEEAFKNSLSIQPSTQAMLGLADLYLYMNRFNDAIPLYTSALEYEPNRLSNVKRHHQLAYCYARLNKNAEALNAFRKCLEALSANIGYLEFAMASEDEELQNIAAFNFHLGFTADLGIARLTTDPSESIKKYERIFEIPGISDEFLVADFFNWASAYTANGENPRSIAKAKIVFQKGLTKFPNDPEILFGCAHTTDESSEEHLEYLMKILDHEYTCQPIYFDYGTVYNNIAWYYTLNKNYKEALPYSQTAIKLNPEHIYSWDTLGEIYYNLGRYQDSIDAFGHCLDSDDSEQVRRAHQYRGNSLIKLGKNKEGQKELNLSK